MLNELLNIIRQGLNLDARLWQDLLLNEGAAHYRLSFLIVLLAGLSEGIAQSMVLFLNQVKPRRFVLSLCINALIFTFGFLFYMVSIDAIAVYLFRATTPTALFYGLALAYAPLIWSFATMIPYLGQGFSLYLQLYHFLTLTVATRILYQLTYQQAVLCVIAGSLLLYVARISIGRPLMRWVRSSQNFFAGTELVDFEDLRQQWQHLFEKQAAKDKGGEA